MKTIALAAILTCLSGLATVATAEDATGSCPTYGCQATIVPVADGRYLLRGEVHYPFGWYPKGPPATQALVFQGDAVVQKIPLHWSELTYICCCPREWLGEFADILNIAVEPGDVLVVMLDNSEPCHKSIQVPTGDVTLDAIDPLKPTDAVAELGVVN